MQIEEYRRMAAASDTHWWYVAVRALLEDLAAPHLAGGPDARFLDAGGGTGNTGRWLATRAPTVLADTSAEALTVAAETRSPAAAMRERADIGRLPHPRASFDAVLCVTVLYHEWVLDPPSVVGELARVTRPGGLVLLMEPGVRRLRRGHDRVTLNARRFSRGDLRRLAEGAGLEVLRATGAFSFLVPPAFVLGAIERDKEVSDVGRNDSGLGGLFPLAARAERALIRRGVNVPFGLSVLTVARKP
jgi:SAM-dependent methyltransferase